MERIILVDKYDKETGTEEKIKAHLEGKLHRGFSVYIFNSKYELLIQKRVRNKYHSGGLWSNTCCSHPRPEESIEDAAHRGLRKEIGFDCKLREIFNFIYKVKLDNNITEHEYLHIFIGKHDKNPNPNRDEIEDWKWIALKELRNDIKNNPNKYTYWFKIVLEKIDNYL